MGFTMPAFDPAEGWDNTTTFPTRPYSATEARNMLNLLHEQMQTYIKDTLIPELESTTADESGAEKIGCESLPDMPGTVANNVFAVLTYLQSLITDISAGTMPDGSVTDAKLSNEATAIKAVLSAHTANNLRHVYVVQTAGTGSAYTATLSPSPDALAFGLTVTLFPHTDCLAAPTLKVNNLSAASLKNNDGSALSAGDMKANRPYRFVYNGTEFRAEAAILKADKASPTLTGAATIASGGSLKITSSTLSDIKVKNIAVIQDGQAIPSIANGDIVLIVK